MDTPLQVAVVMKFSVSDRTEVQPILNKLLRAANGVTRGDYVINGVRENQADCEPQELLISIEEVGTSVWNHLYRRDILTLGDLANRTAHELLKVPSLGPLTLMRIRNQLAIFGLTLRNEGETRTSAINTTSQTG